jgi:hypothetical protein
MNEKTTKCSQLERDILEWNIPEEVLTVLLKDRTTGRNLIWATDDYAERGKGFGANDEMHTEEYPGCRKKDNNRHTGTYCKVMDWNASEPVEFKTIAENGGGHGQ